MPPQSLPIKPFANRSVALVAKEEIETYLSSLNNEDPNNFYRKIIDIVEAPLLTVVMNHAKGNQRRAANCLGINRAALREKLKRHQIFKGKNGKFLAPNVNENNS